MNRSNVRFVDLPNDILFIILKKLDNMDVLYSLLNVDNQRLDSIVLEKTFTNSLNFVLTMSTDDIVSIPHPILDRFCNYILPRIDHNVQSLILEAESMERILLAAHYPNLTALKIFNFDDKIASCYFTDKSPFRHIFREQITDLILLYKTGIDIDIDDIDTNTDIDIDLDVDHDIGFRFRDDPGIDILLDREYPKGIHGYILEFFKNLKYLSITESPILLSLRNSPLTTCFSSTLHKLCVDVNRFEDCLALLDGRLQHLTTFIVTMLYASCNSSVVYKMDDLPNLKCFSLKCICYKNGYDILILPLLHRMSNLEELTLNITNEDRTTLIDGTQINNEILLRIPRLQKFTFHIWTRTDLDHLVHYLSSDDIQRTFTNIGYQHVCCIQYYVTDGVMSHVFSLPFMFDDLEYIGNTFPPIVFDHVRELTVHDPDPFKHEFFIRIARFFPLLKELCVLNFEPQSQISDNLNSNDNQLYSIVEFPYLISLSMPLSHIDYVEQFLNATKTLLPRLTNLEVDYDQLIIVTENFTRDTTRLNCAKVKQLIIEKTLVHSKDFYVYFPLL